MKLSEFMQTLTQTQFLGKWYIDPEGALRLNHNGREFCPITAAHYMISGQELSTIEYICAGNAMQLSEELTCAIANAADGNVNEKNEALHYELWEATIGKERE